MRGAQQLIQAVMGGSLTAPTAPQTTDVASNRREGQVNRPKGALALQAGEEVRDIQLDFMDIIPASMQIHVTREDCLLVIGIKGDSSRIRQFIDKLYSLVKAKQVLVSLTPV
jgi:metal-responsive CopG/Arc/MetJ family transcriptional regulator